jgi:hypothetical protein
LPHQGELASGPRVRTPYPNALPLKQARPARAEGPGSRIPALVLGGLAGEGTHLVEGLASGLFLAGGFEGQPASVGRLGARAVKALEVYALELRGLIALQGDRAQRGSAFNWFRSASDKQVRPSMLVPPMIPYPMELRLADFHLRSGEPLKAGESYQAALLRRPNDLATLLGYQSALVGLDRKVDAEKIQKQIELVRGN